LPARDPLACARCGCVPARGVGVVVCWEGAGIRCFPSLGVSGGCFPRPSCSCSWRAVVAAGCGVPGWLVLVAAWGCAGVAVRVCGLRGVRKAPHVGVFLTGGFRVAVFPSPRPWAVGVAGGVCSRPSLVLCNVSSLGWCGGRGVLCGGLPGVVGAAVPVCVSAVSAWGAVLRGFPAGVPHGSVCCVVVVCTGRDPSSRPCRLVPRAWCRGLACCAGACLPGATATGHGGLDATAGYGGRACLPCRAGLAATTVATARTGARKLVAIAVSLTVVAER
jgi:hypothetical protein